MNAVLKRFSWAWVFIFVFVGWHQGLCVPDPNAKKPLVSVEQTRLSEIFDVLTYPARVVPKINASILSETDGVVRKILAPLGTKVLKNQRLMTLTNTDPIYNFAPVVVVASVTGVVAKIEVTEGSRVVRGQPLAQITDPTQVRIEVEVAASDLGAITSGMKGSFQVPAQEEPLTVEVMGVSPFVDPATGTATAELKLVPRKDNPVQIPPGLIGQASFQSGIHKGIQVPEYAVFYQGKDPQVREVKDGKVRFVPVTLGKTRQGSVEILKGLSENMTLIVRANQYVANGEAVEIQKN